MCDRPRKARAGERACRERRVLVERAGLDKLTLDDLICENVALADIFMPQACAKRA